MATHYVRAPRRNQLALVVLTATVRDARLSYRARGVLARLLSNSEGYGMTAVELAEQGKEGRDAIRAALRELLTLGYIKRHAIVGRDGRFHGVEMYVFDTPNGEAAHREPENPSAENPTAEMPVHKSRKSTKTKTDCGRDLQSATTADPTGMQSQRKPLKRKGGEGMTNERSADGDEQDRYEAGQVAKIDELASKYAGLSDADRASRRTAALDRLGAIDKQLQRPRRRGKVALRRWALNTDVFGLITQRESVLVEIAALDRSGGGRA